MPVRRREVALLLALTAALLVVALVPWLNTPVSKLAAYDGDGPDPHYDAVVNGRALREAAGLVPDDAAYYLYMPGATSLLAGNVKAAAQLFLSPAVPVRDPRAAGWVLRYGGEGLPPGVRGDRELPVAPGVAVVRVRPA